VTNARHSVTADNIQNSLVYGSPCCIIIYTSYKLSKMVRFLAHPVYIHPVIRHSRFDVFSSIC